MSNASESSGPSDCIAALWGSLSRLGGHVADEAVVESIGFDTYYVALRLQDVVPRNLQAAVKTIITQQLQADGWQVQRLRIRPRFIDFVLAKKLTKLS